MDKIYNNFTELKTNNINLLCKNQGYKNLNSSSIITK